MLPLLVKFSQNRFVDESCRWLTTQGRIDESIVILKRIAIVNKKSVPDEVFTGFKVIIKLFHLALKQKNAHFSALVQGSVNYCPKANPWPSKLFANRIC